MRQIFVNLKRFDVPRSAGGLCPLEEPAIWIESVISETIEQGLGAHPEKLRLVYLLPEGLLVTAANCLKSYPKNRMQGLSIGCQGVHWEDVQPGKNFGAFTTSVPAKAAANLGSRWAIIGHSEERRAKLQVMNAYDPDIKEVLERQVRANRAVDQLVRAEVDCALGAGLKVLLCIGETAEERGGGDFEEQKTGIREVLQSQILNGLQNAAEAVRDGKVVIGYEPVWAIGPGKTPPGKEYIAFVSDLIKQTVREKTGAEIPVVYGGGLKEENAAMIAGIETIDGGLVALTRFTGEIGFDVQGLKGIIDRYLAQEKI
jgi:triosephosphate isomerase